MRKHDFRFMSPPHASSIPASNILVRPQCSRVTIDSRTWLRRRGVAAARVRRWQRAVTHKAWWAILIAVMVISFLCYVVGPIVRVIIAIPKSVDVAFFYLLLGEAVVTAALSCLILALTWQPSAARQCLSSSETWFYLFTLFCTAAATVMWTVAQRYTHVDDSTILVSRIFTTFIYSLIGVVCSFIDACQLPNRTKHFIVATVAVTFMCSAVKYFLTPYQTVGFSKTDEALSKTLLLAFGNDAAIVQSFMIASFVLMARLSFRAMRKQYDIVVWRFCSECVVVSHHDDAVAGGAACVGGGGVRGARDMGNGTTLAITPPLRNDDGFHEASHLLHRSGASESNNPRQGQEPGGRERDGAASNLPTALQPLDEGDEEEADHPKGSVSPKDEEEEDVWIPAEPEILWRHTTVWNAFQDWWRRTHREGGNSTTGTSPSPPPATEAATPAGDCPPVEPPAMAAASSTTTDSKTTPLTSTTSTTSTFADLGYAKSVVTPIALAWIASTLVAFEVLRVSRVNVWNVGWGFYAVVASVSLVLPCGAAVVGYNRDALGSLLSTFDFRFNFVNFLWIFWTRNFYLMGSPVCLAIATMSSLAAVFAVTTFETWAPGEYRWFKMVIRLAIIAKMVFAMVSTCQMLVDHVGGVDPFTANACRPGNVGFISVTRTVQFAAGTLFSHGFTILSLLKTCVISGLYPTSCSFVTFGAQRLCKRRSQRSTAATA